jgi:hypothetical protein
MFKVHLSHFVIVTALGGAFALGLHELYGMIVHALSFA